MGDSILKLSDVTKRTGKSRTQIYTAIQRGEFPAQVALSERSVGWKSSDIDAWIASRPTKRQVSASQHNAAA